MTHKHKEVEELLQQLGEPDKAVCNACGEKDGLYILSESDLRATLNPLLQKERDLVKKRILAILNSNDTKEVQCMRVRKEIGG